MTCLGILVATRSPKSEALWSLCTGAHDLESVNLCYSDVYQPQVGQPTSKFWLKPWFLPIGVNWATYSLPNWIMETTLATVTKYISHAFVSRPYGNWSKYNKIWLIQSLVPDLLFAQTLDNECSATLTPTENQIFVLLTTDHSQLFVLTFVLVKNETCFELLPFLPGLQDRR